MSYENKLLRKFSTVGKSGSKNRSDLDSPVVNMMGDPAYLRQSSALINEALQKGFDVLQLANGVEVLLRQIAGAMARRIVWYVREGEAVKQGEELGFIKFGSRVDVFLPLDAEIKVKIGDKMQGGVTVLAELA